MYLKVTVQEVRDRPIAGAIDYANMFEFLGRADLKSSLNGESFVMILSLSGDRLDSRLTENCDILQDSLNDLRLKEMKHRI